MLKGYHRCVLSTVLLAGTLVIGCVERSMQVESDPPGALVYMNDEEVGRTPLRRDFVWYGNYDVVVRKDGYQTLKTETSLAAPWWQWPPFDLFAELMPVRLKDARQIDYALEPIATQPEPAGEIITRADELRRKLESSRYAPPATNAAR